MEYARLVIALRSPLLRLVAAGAATVILAGGVAALLRDDEAEANNEPWQPFYLEAEMTVSSSALTIGTNIAGQAAGETEDESHTVLRWWWGDRDHFRAEFMNSGSSREPGGNTAFVGDGRELWAYREPEATYTRYPLDPMPVGFRVRPITMSALVGALPIREDVDSEHEVVEWLRELNASPDAWARVAGKEILLGRQVTVFESGPADSSRTTSSDGTTMERSSGASRIWIDMSRMVALRHASTSDFQSFDARVTRLDWAIDIPVERLRFDPPAGAQEEVR